MTFRVRRLQNEKPNRLRTLYGFTLAVLPLVKPMAGLYGSWKERQTEQKNRAYRIMILKRFLLITIAILVACILMASMVRALVSMDVLNVGTITSIASAEVQTNEHGHVNILLVGQGDADHDGKDLTDTLIVASLDPTNTKSAVLLSLPRDTYFLRTEKIGKGKLNSFYRDYKSYLIYQQGMAEEDAKKEALAELGAEVGRKLGLDISHVVKVNFTAFVEAVDAIGGIEIDVPYDILDTEYPDENYGYETFAINQGVQQLDGATALKYARSRHTTSDFSRSARQQQVLAAMAKKVKDEGYITDTGFLSAMVQNLSENVDSTLSLREMIGLAELGRAIERDHIITMQLNDRNALYDSFIEPGGFLYTPPRNEFGGTAVLLPVSIPEFPVTWKQPQALGTLLFHNRNMYLTPMSIHVLNNGGASGTARRLATELIRYGFTVNKIANAKLPNKQDSSVLFAGSEEHQESAEFFANLLGLQVAEVPTDLPVEQVSDITIILGADYSYQPLQNLLAN